MPPSGYRRRVRGLLRCSLVAAGLALGRAGLAQRPAPPAPAAAELKRNLALVAASIESENEAVDRLHARTARQLLAYLKTHELSASAAQRLGLAYAAAANDPAHLKVYTYSFGSGGTRGTVHRFVVQWRNAAGRLFVYAPDEECEFYEIHRLNSPGRTQYLLLGNEKADGRCFTSKAYGVELRGDYLLLDNPVFGTKPLLTLCNVDLDFDARQQTLRLSISDEAVPEYNADDLAPWLPPGRPLPKQLTLTFNGQRFVRPATGGGAKAVSRVVYSSANFQFASPRR